MIGYNSRLHGFQGAILNLKLTKYLNDWNSRRSQIAKMYSENLEGVEGLTLPKVHNFDEHVFHQYVVRVDDREKFMNDLQELEVGTGIHYPIPLHMQKAYSDLDYNEGNFPNSEETSKQIVSLPMFPELTDEQVQYVCEKIKEVLQ